MEAVDNKYKKWGWGALIGLAAVIIVAGVAIGVSMKSKPVNVVDGNADSTKTVAANGGNNGEKKTNEGRDNEADAQKEGSNTNTGNSSNTGNTGNTGNNGTTVPGNFLENNNVNKKNTSNANTTPSNMPKTGPEDDMIAFAAWAAIAGLGAYYFLNAKKNA